MQSNAEVKVQCLLRDTQKRFHVPTPLNFYQHFNVFLEHLK